MKSTLLLLLISCQVWAGTPPTSYLSNRKGLDDLSKSNPAAAQEKFLQALRKDPFEARLHLNLGLTFEALNQMDKARASYETAAKLAHDPQALFAAYYNLGEVAQKEKKKDEALAYYQEALKYNPDSKETKVNIEFLTQDDKNQGEGESKDQKDQNDPNQKKSGQGQENKDGKDQKDEKDKDAKNEKPKDDKPKQYGKSKPQPQKFKSEQLSQGDVNKILGEIKQQEQKIRGEFNKKEVKDQPRDKDW